MSGEEGGVWLPDEAATTDLGEALGRRLRAGDLVALHGDLGAGKTAFVRGLARGLRVDDPGAVCSPTYLLVIEHAGPVPLLHVDAYLPDKLDGFLADGGLDYLLQADAVVAVEWADRVAPGLLPAAAVTVTLRPVRRAEVEGRLARVEPAADRPDLAIATDTP